LQGLAHAHHHHVGNHTLFGVEFATQGVLSKPELRQDLTAAQVAAKSLVASRAKTASNRTARLRRNAQGAAFFAGNKNGFNRVTVTYIEQPFDGAVG
jgi:hypothetical protein